MHRIPAAVILSLLLLAPAARAGDQGDPAQSCDGSTAAYEKAMKDAGPQQHDQLRAAQRLWIQYRDANCLYYGMDEGTIARIDAGECMRSMTEACARELEGLGRQ